MKDLAGRVALVTGSATGLGREIVTRLAERGADVIINYSRSAAEAEETADMCREHGSQAEIVKANVAEPEDCKALAEAAARRGRLDILVNNAGITRHARDHGDLNALSKDDFMAVWDPLILAKLRVPASSPINSPPGEVIFGCDCKPPLTIARAP